MKQIVFSDLVQISPFEWEISQRVIPGMKVPVVLFATEKMIRNSLIDRSVDQAIHAAFLPGIVDRICVMPDMHQGYGFPIGGVAATSAEHGVISPGAIGYDINCGVRLLSSQIPYETIMPHLKEILAEINSLCPSGVGSSGRMQISRKDLESICETGIQWADRKGFLLEGEADAIEDRGRMHPENLNGISKKAFERGLPQLGSLGAGNHFIEIDRVEKIFDQQVADEFGLCEGATVVQIHTGSRGFGHQVCTDFVRMFNDAADQYHYDLPDRELACAPIHSRLGEQYLSAMYAAANFAFVNRQILAASVREAFDNILGKYFHSTTLHTVYDLAHNIAKIELLDIRGKKMRVCVHRKGATRALGPGNALLPEKFRMTGQPVLIPGSMGTSSWVLAGTHIAAEKSLNSCCHGAGRLLSRSKARRTINSRSVAVDLREGGIEFLAGSEGALSEEAPAAYKAVDEVIECVTEVGIATRVAKLIPVAVVKG
jgi:tRNA-splicing ligase RtcB